MTTSSETTISLSAAVQSILAPYLDEDILDYIESILSQDPHDEDAQETVEELLRGSIDIDTNDDDDANTEQIINRFFQQLSIGDNDDVHPTTTTSTTTKNRTNDSNEINDDTTAQKLTKAVTMKEYDIQTFASGLEAAPMEEESKRSARMAQRNLAFTLASSASPSPPPSLPSSLPSSNVVGGSSCEEKHVHENDNNGNENENENIYGDDSDDASNQSNHNDDSDSDIDDDESVDEYIQEGECELCERTIKLTRHHLIPKSTWPRIKPRFLQAAPHILNNDINTAEKILGIGSLPPNLTEKDLASGSSIRLFLICHTSLICRQCHSMVHRLYNNMELAEDKNTIDKLLQDENVYKFCKWASSQKVKGRGFDKSLRKRKGNN